MHEPPPHTGAYDCVNAHEPPPHSGAKHRVNVQRPPGHDVGDVEPGLEQYEPGLHASQAVCPLVGWKPPARHGSHSAVPLMLATDPAEHGVGAVAPALQLWPSKHARHSDCAALPSLPEKLPAAATTPPKASSEAGAARRVHWGPRPQDLFGCF